MNLFDPARRYLNDRPVLNTYHGHAIPNLSLFPERDENKIRLTIMIPAGGSSRYESRQISRVVDIADLAKTLDAFKTDPENTIETLFELSLSVYEPSVEDLARSIRRDHKQDQTRAKSYTNVSNLDDQIASIEL